MTILLGPSLSSPVVVAARQQQQQRRVPLHKNLIFLTLVGLASLFMMLSFVLYTQLDDVMEDGTDDLVGVLGSGGGDGLVRDVIRTQTGKLKHHFSAFRRQKRKQQQQQPVEEKKTTRRATNSNDDDDDAGGPPLVDETQRAIIRFRDDQEKAQERRRRLGQLSPREKFEQEILDPEDWERVQASVQKLRRQPDPSTAEDDDIPYDIHDCPHDPPSSTSSTSSSTTQNQQYPHAWNVMTVLENWNPDETEIPHQIYQGICVFDWNDPKDRQKAANYRRREVPFVVRNFPEVVRAAERWMSPGYLEELIGDEQVTNEHSRNNHFMYWKTRPPQAGDYDHNVYRPPTDSVQLTYGEWLKRARELEQPQPPRRQTKQDHWYFRLNAMYHNHAYLYDELPFFDPSHGKSFTVVHPRQHRGINCRFGMKGVIAEAHFDAHNNFIALMGGRRRYILAHPDQCENMELYPLGHPSARHSRVNWSNAHHNWSDSDRPFTKAQVNEVVLQAGDLLYLPTFWFHFIVSLDINYQCNSRSGDSFEYERYISRCGFGPRREYDRKTIPQGATG